MHGTEITAKYLIANKSPKKAWYRLSLWEVPSGYLVCKDSGAQGRPVHSEAWFRESLIEATKKFDLIYRAKTKPKVVGRVYVEKM